jgi:hypothetical protein
MEGPNHVDFRAEMWSTFVNKKKLKLNTIFENMQLYIFIVAQRISN